VKVKNRFKSLTINKKKRILVLGGTSSFAYDIMHAFLENNFEVFATYRSPKPKSKIHDVNYVFLDISNSNSIIKFLKSIDNYRFTHVLSLIGSESNINKFPTKDIKGTNMYIKTYVTNLIYLIDNLFERNRISKNCNLIILSSRSARFGSRDRYYSVSKSALEGYVKSVGKFTKNSANLNAVSVGLIKGSKMYLEMPNHLVVSHEKRSNNSLLDLKELSTLIFNLTNKKSLSSGQIIYLGPQYE